MDAEESAQSASADVPGPAAAWAGDGAAGLGSVQVGGGVTERPRMAKRYRLGTAATLVAGGALAAAAVVATGSGPSPSGAAKPAVVSSSQLQDQAMRALWRTKPVEQLFPATVAIGSQYVRLGVAGAAGCEVLPKDFVTDLAEAAPETKCVKVLRATYTDITQTVFATVGIVVIDGSAEDREKVWRNWTPDRDSRRPELMPDVFPVPGTAAATWTDQQRTVWNSQSSLDGSYLVYVVSAFADGRPGTMDGQLRVGTVKSLNADSPPVQAALGLSQSFAAQFDEAGKKQ
ncbi:hypothetical protein [Catenulispora subtropica]|uniref:PknH-like extracellular domain-containing protein n=1 Tax=Catenulispora subtropica TaxID=450798 RepID=A0ABN2SMF8_9ACTN